MDDPWMKLLKHMLNLQTLAAMGWLNEQERIRKACKCRCRHRRGRRCAHGCGWVPNRHLVA